MNDYITCPMEKKHETSPVKICLPAPTRQCILFLYGSKGNLLTLFTTAKRSLDIKSATYEKKGL